MFIIGVEYNRSELLEYVGSKQAQSGIIWGPDQPDCVIVTSGGKHSITAGYEDCHQTDGSWTYIGQGAMGDQNPTLHSNRLLTDNEHSVLLFSTREPTQQEAKERGSHSKRYRFEGIFGVRGWEFFIPEHGKRANDKLLLFHLVPAMNIYFGWELGNKIDEDETETTDLQKIRISLRNHDKPYSGFVSTREYKKACTQIRKYAGLRANGICEFCNSTAPFVDIDGIPYLEVHHLRRLADDGPDNPSNVAALCPNCHRRAHFSQDKNLFGDWLKKIVIEKELNLEKSSPSSA